MPETKPDIMSIPEREGIKLHRAGRTYRGKCPMHAGKSHGSLAVYPDSQSWFCYGCNEGGDVIDLIMKLHGLPFKEALVYLGIKNGRPVPPDPEIQRKKRIQKDYQEKIMAAYENLCGQARELHRLRLMAKANPGISEVAAIEFALRMGDLAAIDHKLDIILMGDFEDHIELLKEMKNHENDVDRRAA